MELREELINYKETTIEMIDAVRNGNYDGLDDLIQERQNIINNIMSLDYVKEDFKNVCEEILLLKYEKELNEIMNNEKNTIKEKINDIQKNKNAYNSYNKRFLKNSYFLKKKV